ncbi:MAG: hypothetical protein ACHQ3P_10475 [Candidatus Limnocylindrales bacterium]
MADGVTGSMDPFTSPHDRHDLLLIAAHASGDLAGHEFAQADELVATCPDCALLFGDLQVIVAATAALPAVERPRDFRLSPADAARLRPMGWRRAVGWLRGGSTSRGGAMRPLAIGLTTLGLVGLVFSATPLSNGLGGTGASVPQALDESAGGGRNSAVSGAVNDLGPSAGPAVQLPVAGGAGAVASAAASAAALPAPSAAAVPAPAAGATAGPAGAGGGSGKGASAPSVAPSEAPLLVAGLAPSPAAGSTPLPATVGPPVDTSSAPVPVLALVSLGLLVVGLALFALARARS